MSRKNKSKPRAPVERLLRVTEAAERLGLQPSTVRAMVLQKRIAIVRLSPRAIRIAESEIARLIKRGTVPARERVASSRQGAVELHV